MRSLITIRGRCDVSTDLSLVVVEELTTPGSGKSLPEKERRTDSELTADSALYIPTTCRCEFAECQFHIADTDKTKLSCLVLFLVKLPRKYLRRCTYMVISCCDLDL